MSVQILLSTYNGECYLRPLLDSLLTQHYPELSILIRDDGSSDSTLKLLHRYAEECNYIKIVCGEHRGFIRSFFSLIEHASATADYIALCDQDDVWQPNKISRAVSCLSRYSNQVPALYCSRLSLANENLQPIGLSKVPKRELTFRNALVENQASGCTMLMNRAAHALLRQVPADCISHDWWIYLAVSAYGTVVYDREPTILYRKHPTNAIGISSGFGEIWRNKITGFLQDGKLHRVVKQAEEFRRLHAPSLPSAQRRILERFLESRMHFWSRVGYALACDVYRQSTLDQCILRVRIALDCL